MYSVLCILSKCHNSLFFYTQFSYILLIWWYNIKFIFAPFNYGNKAFVSTLTLFFLMNFLFFSQQIKKVIVVDVTNFKIQPLTCEYHRLWCVSLLKNACLSQSAYIRGAFFLTSFPVGREVVTIKNFFIIGFTSFFIPDI